jgi:hypothetical protein
LLFFVGVEDFYQARAVNLQRKAYRLGVVEGMQVQEVDLLVGLLLFVTAVGDALQADVAVCLLAV